ncbi:hypothetical protein [Paraprevotella clara]|uniref:Uncharacterized protein n=1 Tax=Paraprevotella clara YIT 11840 TaxID=762968 RepID=G5SVN8_9BACT|nr:hypothetical protein [Paraprevotella clara]EHG98693.1 hypothetical protein HMPREF9441_03455 [Paraprevotella clara YIT 11840]
MNKQMKYLVEGITKDIIAYLMEDNRCDLSTALKEFYNSETFAKLSDESTGLYIESSAYVYEMLKGELKFGEI